MTEGANDRADGTSSEDRTGVIGTAIENGVAGSGDIAANGNAISHEHTSIQQFELEISETICSVLVAIPAYNEAATISDIVQRADEHADYVLVIDDGSDDDTAARATAAGATVIEHRRNRGYGAAIKTAFEAAFRYDANHLVILDGDGQHDPADVPRLVAAQKRTDAHLVIGSRFVDGAVSNAPLYRRVGLKTINGLTNLSLGVVRAASRVSDTQSGFRAYDRTAIETLAADQNIGDWMDASTDILYHAHHHSYSIEEVPITVTYDVANASTQAPLSHGVVLVRNILKTIERERPLTALAVPGFGLTFSGLSVGYLSLDNYIQSGTFPIGLALTAAFLMLVGTFACFTAIVLHALSTYFANTGMEGRRVR
ncbi:glycosyltransferase family 2 protein [Halocatena salina]|uniref:Glycosyltransferase family 2 protein n=1 Tax=Halocatena salina TaxID=2934340 RepID=A0A8U0A5F8_9EURY|nr:glycosyltransferase family 2 protein [Halocatena salina]UPM44440.1 glycosyltransferase family 2 protein [Halocatena salina]